MAASPPLLEVAAVAMVLCGLCGVGWGWSEKRQARVGWVAMSRRGRSEKHRPHRRNY